MGGVLKFLWRMVKWPLMLLGLAAWLGAAAFAAQYLWTARAGTELVDMIAAGVAVAGLLIAMVASLIALRLTGSLIAFLFCVGFGAAALVGGMWGTPGREDYAMAGVGLLAAIGVAAFPLLITRRLTLSLFLAAIVGALGGSSLIGGKLPTMSDSAPSAEAPAATAPLPPPPAASAPSAAVDTGPLAAPMTDTPAARAVEKEEAARAETDKAAKDVLSAPSGSGSGAVAPSPVKASQFQVAELRFNKPAQMRIEQPSTVAATIALPGSSAPVSLGDIGPTVTRETKITRKVRVELIAADFKIEKLHTIDTVLLTPDTPGQWSWRVTPQKEGANRKMLLQVFGVLEEDGVAQGEVLIKTYEEVIPVAVTPLDRARLVADMVAKTWEPFAGLAGVIGGISVFFGNLAKALRRRKEPVAA